MLALLPEAMQEGGCVVAYLRDTRRDAPVRAKSHHLMKNMSTRFAGSGGGFILEMQLHIDEYLLQHGGFLEQALGFVDRDNTVFDALLIL